MLSFGTNLLIHVFAAFLPPTSSDDRDFYDVLGVPRNASDEDIRKAYKKKSLALHPDKVAQFGRDPEEAAREYELVQQAYAVLSNPKKRQAYHAVQCSPTRFHFVESGAFMNPTALMENLAHASPWTKLRLVIIVGVIFCLILLQPILIAAKLNQTLEEDGGVLETTQWTVILIPLWIFHGLLILLISLTTVFAPTEARLSLLLTALNQVSWLAAEAVLANRWDGNLTNRYSTIFIPVYIGLFLRCIQAIENARQVGRDIKRMVSSNYMMEKVLHGRDLDDLPEEEREEIYKKYIIVHVPDDIVIEAETEAAVEQCRVESSHEYEKAQEVMGQSIAMFSNTIVFGVTFVALVVSKLDNKIDADWWAVFAPIWIYLGAQIVYSGYTCCCAAVPGQEIIVQLSPASNDENVTDQTTEAASTSKTQNSNTESSSIFVAAEGSTKDFNEPKAFSAAQGSAIDVNEPNARSDVVIEKESATTASTPVNESKNEVSSDPVVAQSHESVMTKSESMNQTEGPRNVSSDKPESSTADNADEEIPSIQIDEETFRAWQSAYAEAEQSAQQEQSRAVMNCIIVGCQTLMLCLVVGKLNNDYHIHPHQGYNAMWVLFPVFVFVGLCFCLCVCAICGASVDEESGEARVADGTQQVDEKDAEKAEWDLPVQEQKTTLPSPAELLDKPAATKTDRDSSMDAEIPPSTVNDMADLD